MSDVLYDLVFRGELIKNADLQQTKGNIQSLFKINEQKVDALFSGKAITLKKGLDFSAASKYRVAIKKAGAVVELIEQVAEKKKTLGKAVFGVSDPADSHENKGVTESDAAAHLTDDKKTIESQSLANNAAEESSESSFVLAPVGAEVLRRDERDHEPTVNIDLAAYSLADHDGNLLQPHEIAEEVAVEIHLDGSISLSEVGDNLLSEGEREKEVAPDIAVSNMSLAEPGVIIVEPKEQPKADIDISHLSLTPEKAGS